MSQVLLVRHGQASFGAADYDQLSRTGELQSRTLGRAMTALGSPDRVVSGRMRRHAQTQVALCEAAGWDRLPDVDPGWDEFDHVQVLAAHTPPDGEAGEPATDRGERAAFQRWFESATLRWTSGEHDDSGDYDETFSAFTRRVETALARLVDALPRRSTAVVVTSGGPIAWVAASLLADDVESRTRLWLRLNPVTVNTGLTRLVVGRRGTTLVSFNDHAHVTGDLLTYR